MTRALRQGFGGVRGTAEPSFGGAASRSRLEPRVRLGALETFQPVLLALLLGCVLMVLIREGRAFEIAGTSLLKGAAFMALLFALAVSEYPASWRLEDTVVYLAEVSLAPFRLFVVVATGLLLFGGMLALLSLAGSRSGRKQR